MSHYSPPYADNQPIKVVPVNETKDTKYDGQPHKILAYLKHNGKNKPIIKVDGYLSVVGKEGLYKIHEDKFEEIDNLIMYRVQKNNIPLKYTRRDHQYYFSSSCIAQISNAKNKI